MKEEEVDVDIAAVDEEIASDEKLRNGGPDEDSLWAEDEPDEDMKGWKMKVLMDDEGDP